MWQDKKIILYAPPDHNLNFLFNNREEQGPDHAYRHDTALLLSVNGGPMTISYFGTV